MVGPRDLDGEFEPLWLPALPPPCPVKIKGRGMGRKAEKQARSNMPIRAAIEG